MKIGIYCNLTADSLKNKNQKCLLSGPLPNIILSNPHNVLGCHGNTKTKFSKNILKFNSSEAMRAIKLKLFRNVHSISLYKNNVYIADAYALWLLW